MRLKPGSYLILGMLDRGIQTGYAIKRTVDLSTRFFWAASLAQVYPELANLEENGYVISTGTTRQASPQDLPPDRKGASGTGSTANASLTSSSATKDC